MQKPLNKPIQVISSCSTTGEFTPIRIRFEADNCELVTVDIIDVLKRDSRTGPQFSQFLHYVCRGIVYDRIRTFILCYKISTHTWTLHKYIV